MTNYYKILSIIWLYCFEEFLCQDSDTWNMNHKLRIDKLKNYDKMALPHINANGTTTVYLQMQIQSLWIDDDKQIFNVNAWVAMQWMDDRLKYDYKDYGNLVNAHYKDGEIWKPNIHVYNNARLSNFDHYKNVHLLVYPTGEVLWVPPAHFEASCTLELKFWPFDIQTCEIFLGSWTYDGFQLDLQIMHNSSEVDTRTHSDYTSNNWHVLEATVHRHMTKYDCCEEPYVHLSHVFKIKRNSPTFASVVVVPAVVLPIFLMLQFVLPVDHTKRLTIGCVSAILVLLEILFLKQALPKLGTSVPLIVHYYSQNFVMVVLTVAISAGLGRLAHPQNPVVSYPPPEIVKRIMTGIPATLLFLRAHADKVGLSGSSVEDGEILDKPSQPCYAHEWLFLAKAGDRIACVLIFIVYVFSLIGYVSPLK